MDIVFERRRRDEIRERRTAIGIREERRDGAAARMLDRQGNDAARERDGRSGNNRAREQALRKIPFALGAGRHVGHARDPLAQACALVIHEEERPVLHDRSTERAAELMAAVFRRILVVRRKVVSRIECASAKELVGGAGETVAARAGEDVHLAAAVASEGGVVGRRAHFELADRIHRRPDANRSELRVHVVDAVEQVVGKVLARAVHREREVASHRARRSLRRRRRSGREQREFQEVPPIERQLGHQPVVKSRGQRRRVTIHRNENCAHVHRRRGGLQREGQVESQILIDGEFDARRKRAVLAAFDFDAVRPRFEFRGDIASLVVRNHATYFRRGFVDEPQFYLAGGCARRIEHDAPHRGALRLRGSLGDDEQEEEQDDVDTYTHITHKDIG